jgi:hypothetical protein
MEGPSGKFDGPDIHWAKVSTALLSSRAACEANHALKQPTTIEWFLYAIAELFQPDVSLGIDESVWLVQWFASSRISEARQEMSSLIEAKHHKFDSHGIVVLDMLRYPLEVWTQKDFFHDEPDRYALNPCWWGQDGYQFDDLVVYVYDHNCATWWQ